MSNNRSKKPAAPVGTLDFSILLVLIEDLEKANVEQAALVGTLQAKLWHAEQEIARLSAPLITPAPAQRRPWWRRILGGT